MTRQTFGRKPLSLDDIRARLDVGEHTRDWLDQFFNDEHDPSEPKKMTRPPYLFALPEPKHLAPNPDEWRPIPTFDNYEMNYLGHLRYVGSSNTIPWVEMEGVKWYELQSKVGTDGYQVHIFPMITLVKKTFPEIGLK